MYLATLSRMPGTPWLWLYAPTLLTSLSNHLARSMTSCLNPNAVLRASSLSSKGGYSSMLSTWRKNVMGFWSSCWGLPMFAEMTWSKGRESLSPGGVGGWPFFKFAR